MPTPSLRDRPFQAFLSHAHADRDVVDRLHAWLADTAGLNVWYDGSHLPASARIASELGNAMPQCRAAVLVLSAAAVASGWVEDEWNLACEQRNARDASGQFRIVPVRIEDCEVPRFLAATKWIDFAGRLEDPAAYAEILHGLYADAIDVEAVRPVDVYVSRTWREGRERILADQVCDALGASGLRLIGDSPEWPSFQGDRISAIMRSCSGAVSIVPNRPRAGGDDKLKYFLREARAAADLGLPHALFAEDGAELPAPLAERALRLPGEGFRGDGPLEAMVVDAVEDLQERCRQAGGGHHVFFATDLAAGPRNAAVRRLLQTVTGLPCAIGEQLRGDAIQKSIVEQIRDAVLVIADITDDNLNICIEAGIARGAGVELYLLARGPRRQPPFMLRDIEPRFYRDDVEMLGLVHRIARPYRRKVLAPSA